MSSEPPNPVQSYARWDEKLTLNDQNGAGQKAAQECSDRWAGAGREVLRAQPNYPGDDFNIVLRWSAA
jgi:hypothetical protein